MENAKKLNSFMVRLHASNEGRGTVQPTISLDFLCTSVYLDNLPKMLSMFNSALDLAVEIQETVPSKA